MLASTIASAFDDEEWIYEMKWDGYRCMALVMDGNVQLWSRNGLSFNKKYPAIVEALAKGIHHHALIDGEVIALVKGKSSFQALQHAEETKPELRYCMFDLLMLDDHSLELFPLLDRKQLLQDLLKNNRQESLEYTEHIVGKGIHFFEQIQKKGLEGIMAKKADSTYAANFRSKQWLKIKNRNDREAIIVGYTQPSGGRKYFGALILAEKNGNAYRYIGHTGTGFNEATLKELYEKMQALVTDRSVFAERIKVNAPVTWVNPVLVCQLYFTEETESGMLRHPVFMGLRTDKKAAEVTHEDEVAVPARRSRVSTVSKSATMKRATATVKDKVEETLDELEESKTASAELAVGDKKIAVSNPAKVYFPEKGITKGDVIAYYHSMAKWILPHLKGRPMSLKRHPNGIHGESFFHKNAGENAPSWVKTFDVYSESSERNIEYILCNDVASLLYLANLGCIEMNPWLSTYKKPEHPSFIAIDIDPSEGNSFEQVVETALAVREVTDKAGLVSFCKTSGSSGLHVYIPFGAKYDYDTLKPFAELLATLVQELVPDFTSLERNLKKRGKKIYVDYLQNRRGQTLASAYSLRPVEDASVSAPLEWKEVKKGLHPSQFNIFNIEKRVSAKGDLFKDVLTVKNDLRKAMKALQV